METNSETEEFRKRKDKAVLHGRAGGGEIFSGIMDYAYGLGYSSREAFVQAIKGKKILDLGSGLGGLAKDTFFQQVDCQVISLNPRLATDMRRDEKEATKEYVEEMVPEMPSLRRLINKLRGMPEEDYLKEIQKAHDQRAVAGFAHSLPFQDNSFDLIFDKEAISKYATSQDYDFVDKSTPEEKELFRKSLREMIRVLKPGGKIRIGDIFGYGSSEDWKQRILDELGLDYEILWEDLRGKKIYPNLWGDKRAIGVEIVKH